MGPDKWEVVKSLKKGKHVRGTLFVIPPDHALGKLLRIIDFKLDIIVPYIYDRFITS